MLVAMCNISDLEEYDDQAHTIKTDLNTRNRGNIEQMGEKQRPMAQDSLDDESSTDKAWAIHAAIIGLNSGNLLFRGLGLDPENPEMLTVACLSVIAIALPFQAIFFLINSYIQEAVNVHEIEYQMLLRLSIICQTVSYLSLIAIGVLMFATHLYIGISFAVGSMIAIFLVRSALTQVDKMARS
jgi:hypothetical protein|tara:strand:+ start:124 stop:675 length:552 start_codon:yes stop_codon:yes gene_type:complete